MPSVRETKCNYRRRWDSSGCGKIGCGTQVAADAADLTMLRTSRGCVLQVAVKVDLKWLWSSKWLWTSHVLAPTKPKQIF